MNNNNIILCQPDSKKSCSICCGLFNFLDISRENLSNILSNAEKRVNTFKDDHIKWIKTFDLMGIRDVTSYICPFQGFIDSSKPGCFLHAALNENDLRDLSIFGKKICSHFLCPSHIIFNNRIKQILIDFIDDWYYYSIAIIDPESFTWLVDCLINDFHVQFDKNSSNHVIIRDIFYRSLEIHSKYLNHMDIPIFQYSISEYNLNKHKFYLKSNSYKTNKHRIQIKKNIELLLK